MPDTPSLSELIDARLSALALTDEDFILKTGMRDRAKGRTWLERAREEGIYSQPEELLRWLGDGLELDAAAIADAHKETRRRAHEASWQEFCRNFRPHAVLVTERSIPSPIHVCALGGFHRKKLVEFPEDLLAEQYSAYVRSEMPESIPTFGKVVGFVLNHAPDQAEEYDLDGALKRELSSALMTGQAYFGTPL
jgi:hypothetical protein